MTTYSIIRTHSDLSLPEKTIVTCTQVYTHLRSDRQAIDFMLEIAEDRLDTFGVKGFDCTYTLQNGEKSLATVSVYAFEGCLSKVKFL